MPKNVQTTVQLHSFHMLARLCSKSFKLSFSTTWTKNFQMVQAGFRKGRGIKDKIANICWIIEKARNSTKTSISVSLTTLKPVTVWLTTNCGKFLKWWEYQTTLPVLWETCMWVKKQQLGLDMEQQTESKLGKEYDKVVYCYSAYLTYMQSTSCKMLGWITHKLE